MLHRDTQNRIRDECSRRSQSEPLAALVSVAAVCLVVSLSVGLLTDTIPELGNDREIADPAADSVWQDIRTDGAFDVNTTIPTTVERSSLPDGYAVAVEVQTVRDDGTIRQAGNAQFDTAGVVTDAVPPETAETVTRPVSVRLQPGDVRPGRLIVEVWE
jgi:hypothetical protein